MSEVGYTTLLAPCTGEYREKRSVFLSYGFPISRGFSEVRARQKALRLEHSAARHCCYGAVLDPSGESFCQSDDGEPAGTGGRPILGAIRAAGLQCVLVLVVRYYGGVKLGVPGLIAAYRLATENALQLARVVDKYPVVYYAISATYLQLHSVLDFVRATGGRQTQLAYGATECNLQVGWPQSAQSAVEEWLGGHLAPLSWHQMQAEKAEVGQ